jgi:hypothetical protein
VVPVLGVKEGQGGLSLLPNINMPDKTARFSSRALILTAMFAEADRTCISLI